MRTASGEHAWTVEQRGRADEYGCPYVVLSAKGRVLGNYVAPEIHVGGVVARVKAAKVLDVETGALLASVRRQPFRLSSRYKVRFVAPTSATLRKLVVTVAYANWRYTVEDTSD